MDPSPQDRLLAAATELGINPAILMVTLSKHLNAVVPQTTQANASDPSSLELGIQSSASFNARHQLFGGEGQAPPTGSAGSPLVLPSAVLPPVEKAGPPIPVPSSQGIQSSAPFTDQHQPLGEAGLGPPASSAGSSLALPSVVLPPVRATDPPLPTPSSQAMSHSAAPITSALPPASLSSQLPATAGGALDYFQTGPPILPALSSTSAIHPRLKMIQQTLSGHMQAFGQPSPAPQQLLPWEGNQPVATQWGAIGPVPSVLPMPSAVPAALASAFPVTPSKAGGHSERPLPRVTAKVAATVRKPGQHQKAKPAEKLKPRVGVPIPYKKLYIVPVSSIEQLSEQVKYACSVSNLAGHPDLHNAMSDEEVRQEIRNYFSEERCGIDWTKHSLEWFELSRQSGTLLWPTNLRAFPTGKDLANTYQGKKLLIGRLTTTADIPKFKETLKGATIRFRKASGSYRARGRRLSNDSDGDTVIKTFTCMSCNGTFALDEKLTHEGKCPVRIQPRKRNISTASRHSRHHSEPPDVSPVATRKKKRTRGNPASSDGEVEIFAREPKRLRSRTFTKQDLKGLSDEELDEILDDPDANDEGEDVDVPGMGLYRHRSLELDGQKRDSEDEDLEDEKDELDEDDDDENGLRDTSDEEDLDPTYREVNSGEENEEEWGTSVGVRSGPSHSRSKGSYLW
ncbi:hypothetical protein M407DRAFT_13076 [Tulasnella calospora MUT 4182]|uniref:Uncharacterized protein n=1 Tax=Tulasnella calospora MUT 4182 TaxID=1051891 RepID=A0A0C3K3D7_9AGAM|nr:hypothetical protein M407DRAFT_13076 [Tulasnella calospora MUT 4182]